VVINIEDARPGMILSEDIILGNGLVLVNASTVLSETLIATLKRREIHEIIILGEGQTLNEEAGPVQETPRQIEEKKAVEEEQKKVEEAKAIENAKPTLPKLALFVSEDIMSAKLTIEPTGLPTENLTALDILDYLNANGITFGIDEQLIVTTVTAWKKTKKFVEMPDVAKGSMPMPGKEGALELHVKYLSKRGDIEAAQKNSNYWLLASQGIDLQRVNAGTLIAEKQMGTPPVPGKTIKAELVPIKEVIKTKVDIDANADFAKDNSQVIAKITGVVYYVDTHIGVLPINFDGGVELAITPDRMRADLTVHPPGEEGKPPTAQHIFDLLTKNGVTYGVKNDLISKMMSAILESHYPEGTVVIAEGTQARDGENGKVEYLFDTETSLKPKQNSDGSVDFKNVNLFTSVAKDTELARVHPPTKGVPGRDITGRDLPAQNGQPIALPVGAKTHAHPNKPDTLIAETDGVVRLNGLLVEIQEGYVVKSDVSYATGNINYAKSITVDGDIKSGFKIECGGDLQVSGTIEDAEVLVGGNLLSKMGFIGSGKGLIDAKGDVNIGFAKNQVMRSRKNVVIAKEALNCTIFARKAVTIHGNPLSIAGGMVTARESITVFTVGNKTGIRTILEVGVDFALVEELKKTETMLAELNENKNKIIQTLKKYDQLIAVKKKLAPKEEFLYTKLKATQLKFDQQFKLLEDRKKIINSKIYDFNNAYIKIEHAAMPGTIFKIGERKHLVKQEIIGPKSVRYIDAEIRIL
jgi:uncharacterized protein